MPRTLADVLHHFLPEAGEAPDPQPRAEPDSLLGIPLDDRDTLRRALVWNLAVELGRHGRRATLLAPDAPGADLAWPEDGRTLGARVERRPAATPSELLAAPGAARPADSAPLRVACLPTAWVPRLAEAAGRLRWVVLLARPDPDARLEIYAALKRMARALPEARFGLVLHGARSLEVARRGFERVALTAERCLNLRLRSYGLLVEDLEVCRSLVSGRPVALSHPRSAAARALADVAARILADRDGSSERN